MPDSEFRPRLRPNLRAAPTESPDQVALHDTRRLSPAVLGLSRIGVELANLFDGTRTLREIQSYAASQGANVPLEQFTALASALDDALFLDSPAFQAYETGPVRRPSCIGCYPPEPDAIRQQLRGLFTGPDGPGLPGTQSTKKRLRAALLPHMDYARGGVTYGWGFKELVEQTDAKLFVIVATSHYSAHRFTLSRMNFETPLGLVETDRAYVDRIAEQYGPGAFDDPHAHLPEHSIELEVVLLKYLFENRGPFRIVPLLVGSFGDCVRRGANPGNAADIRRMVAALQHAEAAAGEPVCYLISGDLAHIGPKFGDPDPVNDSQLAVSKTQDEKLLDRLTAADASGYFDVIEAEADDRRICGLPPTWLTLAAAKPRSGKVLHYGRYVHPRGHESVSFAAAAFYE